MHLSASEQKLRKLVVALDHSHALLTLIQGVLAFNRSSVL